MFEGEESPLEQQVWRRAQLYRQGEEAAGQPAAGKQPAYSSPHFAPIMKKTDELRAG